MTYFNEHPIEWKKLYDLVYEKLSIKEDPYVIGFEKMLNENIEKAFGFRINEHTMGDDITIYNKEEDDE